MAHSSEQVNTRNHRAPILVLTAPPRVTLSDIARKANCSLSFVSGCAHGRKRPTKRVMDAAESLLGVPAAELFPAWNGASR